MSDFAPISTAHVTDVCKIGKGSACCRYLVMAPGGACAKASALRATLDSRVAAGAMSARGDNCSGPPFFDADQ